MDPTTGDHPRRRVSRPSAVAMTEANFTPVLAPARRTRYEVAICPLRLLPTLTDQWETLNDFGTNGWAIVGIDDGVVYLQREAIA